MRKSATTIQEKAAIAAEIADDAYESAWVISASPIRARPDEWILDSGASRHMTADRKAFVTYKRSAFIAGQLLDTASSQTSISTRSLRIRMARCHKRCTSIRS